MDSYFLTRDDWDAVMELGVGPMDPEKIKLDTQTKTAFTKMYNAQSHPLPFMKASNAAAAKPTSAKREKPDLEEAIDESDDGEIVEEVKDEDDEGDVDLSKDKYVKQAKKKKAAAPKAVAKGAAKGKGKKKAAADEDEEDIDSEEEVKPKKSRAKAKAKK